MLPTLADLLNAPTTLRHGEDEYQLRQPTLLECATYQRWLEQEARCAAARAVELDDTDRRNLLRDVNADITAKVYAWGGEVCVRSLRTPDGIAKLVSITLADQGVTEAIARDMVAAKLDEIAQVLVAAVGDEDAGKAEALASVLAGLGLPPTWLRRPLSSSSTPHSTEPSQNLAP